MGAEPGGPTVDVTAVVLDAVAEADLAHHLEVVGRAHPQPLGLEELALLLEERQLVLELELDAADRALHALGAGDVVRGREDVHLLLLVDDLSGHGVQGVDALDLVAEELDADRELLVDRDDLDGVAADPEGAAGEGEVVAGVLHLDEAPQQLVALDLEADPEPGHPVDVLLRRAEAVDARHGRDDDDVAPGEQRVGGRVAQPLDLVVDRAVLLDVGVGLRDVGLGLVVVVVGDEVLDGVVGQQLAELVGQLGGQRLVGCHDERGALHLLDEPGRRRRLAGAGGAEQHGVLLPCPDAPRELGDRRRLVAAGGVVRDHLEGGHRALEVGRGTHASTVRPTTDNARLAAHAGHPLLGPPAVDAVCRSAGCGGEAGAPGGGVPPRHEAGPAPEPTSGSGAPRRSR